MLIKWLRSEGGVIDNWLRYRGYVLEMKLGSYGNHLEVLKCEGLQLK